MEDDVDRAGASDVSEVVRDELRQARMAVSALESKCGFKWLERGRDLCVAGRWLECEGNAGQRYLVSSGRGFSLPAVAGRQADGAGRGRHGVDRFDCEEARGEEESDEFDGEQDDGGRNEGQSWGDSEDIAHFCEHNAEARSL